MKVYCIKIVCFVGIFAMIRMHLDGGLHYRPLCLLRCPQSHYAQNQVFSILCQYTLCFEKKIITRLKRSVNLRRGFGHSLARDA